LIKLFPELWKKPIKMMVPRLAERRMKLGKYVQNLYPTASSTYPVPSSTERTMYSGSPQLLPRPDPSTNEKLDLVKKEKVDSNPDTILLPGIIKKEDPNVFKSSNLRTRNWKTQKKRWKDSEDHEIEENVPNNAGNTMNNSWDSYYFSGEDMKPIIGDIVPPLIEPCYNVSTLSEPVKREPLKQSGEITAAERRRQEQQQRAQLTPEEWKLHKASKIIKKFIEELALPEDVGKGAEDLFKQIADCKAMLGRKSETICATALYIAAKFGKTARPLRELCEVLSVKRKHVSKCYSEVMKLRSMGRVKLGQLSSKPGRQSTSATQEYAVRYATKLRLPRDIVNAARLLVQKVEELAIMTGRQPGTIASACIYLAAMMHPDKSHHRSFQQIGLMGQVGDTTIQRAYRQFVLPNIPKLLNRSIPYTSRGRACKNDKSTCTSSVQEIKKEKNTVQEIKKEY